MDEDYTDEFPDFIDTPDDSDWDSPPSPELIEALDFWLGEEDEDEDIEDVDEPYEHDDMYDVESALGSAGYGTDEWYE
jgi:hypothetical protein|tara:strand:- start:209 stop:442 length:234 start_codon:yes stop_codon:yes gene_type:complete